MSELAVTPCQDIGLDNLESLLKRYQLELHRVDDDQPLPGSFWGDPEAGIIQNRLYIRPSTPVQSALHEACHFICMDTARRSQLDTDAGGGYNEENGVCYLQILLSGYLAGFDPDTMLRDMDRWGYSFRLGSARAWFEQDAEDARQWLIDHQLIQPDNTPTWKLRV